MSKKVFDLERKRQLVAQALDLIKEGGTSRKAALEKIAATEDVSFSSLDRWTHGINMGDPARMETSSKKGGKVRRVKRTAPADGAQERPAGAPFWHLTWRDGEAWFDTPDAAMAEASRLASTEGVSNIQLWQKRQIKLTITAQLVEEE